MYSFTKREQIVILIVVLALVFGVVFKFAIFDKINARQDELEVMTEEAQLELFQENETEDENEVKEVDIVEDTTIMIHISGQVEKPGLIELKLGERLKDAVEYAGGLKNDADIDKINLAKKLSDEDKVYIPKVGEETEVQGTVDMNVESSQSTSVDVGGKININNCSKESLITLPGIGEVTAGKIINYRAENPFNSIEEIKNVSGIGDKKFEAIKDSIVVK